MEHQRVSWPDQPADGPPLVGRTRERASLQEHLTAGTDSQGRLVLIGGAAGIGKTTLVRDLIRDARSRDVTSSTIIPRQSYKANKPIIRTIHQQ
jgi:tRNA A37 threonylcarbamoyladenosine biosynthesis protein TsaE